MMLLKQGKRQKLNIIGISLIVILKRNILKKYNRSFDRIKEMVCNRMNIGLRVLEKYID